MKKVSACVSLLFGVTLLLLYWLRPDWAAAVTIFPAWIWLLLVLFALPIKKQKLPWITLACWFFFGLFHVEEWQSLLRTLVPVTKLNQELRVTSINCSGSLDALKEAFSENPDILLIQESPRRENLEELVSKYEGYEVLYGLDTSIVAKGEISSVQETPFFRAGDVVIGNDRYFVVSLRLATSNPRIDLWSPDCWRFQSRMRRRQLSQIDDVMDLFPSDAMIIVGGDFNVPQGDKVFHQLDENLVDTFATGGRGWGNTILSDFPVLRIDQIWASPELSCHHAYSQRSEFTDHKFYSARLELADSKQ